MPDHQTDPPPEKSESPSGEGVQEFASAHFVEEGPSFNRICDPIEIGPTPTRKKWGGPVRPRQAGELSTNGRGTAVSVWVQSQSLDVVLWRNTQQKQTMIKVIKNKKLDKQKLSQPT